MTEKATGVCLRCDEPAGIDGQEQLTFLVTTTGIETRWMHLECDIRGRVGSLGHLQRRCSCYGGLEEDPAGMSKREAARAAADFYLRQRTFE